MYSHFPLDELHQHIEEIAKLNFVLPAASLSFCLVTSPQPSPSLRATPQAPLKSTCGGKKEKEKSSDRLINLRRLSWLTNSTATALFFSLSHSFPAPFFPLVIKQGFYLQPTLLTSRKREIKVIVRSSLTACRAHWSFLIFPPSSLQASFVSFFPPFLPKWEFVHCFATIQFFCWKTILMGGGVVN